MSTIVDAAAIVGGFATMGVPLAMMIGKHRDKQLRSTITEVVAAAVKPLDDKVDALQLEQARQYGGNSNGIRQEVNGIASAVSNLVGRFEQHIAENS